MAVSLFGVASGIYTGVKLGIEYGLLIFATTVWWVMNVGWVLDSQSTQERGGGPR